VIGTAFTRSGPRASLGGVHARSPFAHSEGALPLPQLRTLLIERPTQMPFPLSRGQLHALYGGLCRRL